MASWFGAPATVIRPNVSGISAAAVAALMNQVRQYFLAGTTLACDQDLRVTWSRIVRLLDNIHHHTTQTEKELRFQCSPLKTHRPPQYAERRPLSNLLMKMIESTVEVWRSQLFLRGM